MKANLTTPTHAQKGGIMAKKEPIMINVGNVDWKLLREQKRTLVKMYSQGKNEIKKDTLIGIVCFLDSIQDQAAEKIGSIKVFGFKS